MEELRKTLVIPALMALSIGLILGSASGDIIGPPRYLSCEQFIIDLRFPIGKTWHEMYPTWSLRYSLDSWNDANHDGLLSASDQIDLTDLTALETKWYHVDAVTITIHWTWKEPYPPDFDPTEYPGTEPAETITWPLTNPINTQWHMIYPQFSRPFKITSWTDSTGDGFFSPSDQFDITFTDNGSGPWWAHLDKVTTDITVSVKAFEQPEFPLGFAVEIALVSVVAYAWWRGKHKPL